MQILVIIGFMTVLLTSEVPTGRWPWWAPAAGVGVYLIVTAILARLNAVCFLRHMKTTSRARLGKISHAAARIWLIAGAGMLTWMGFGSLVMDVWGLWYVPLAGELVVLTPFAAALILLWSMEYPMYLATRKHIAAANAPVGAEPPRQGKPRTWTFGEYLGYNIRHHLLFIAAPVSLIILLTDTFQLYVVAAVPEKFQAASLVTAAGVSVAAVFLAAPLMIARIWRTEPLGEGPLRRELENICSVLEMRFRELLVWKSGGAIANAGVMGMVGPLRYVLLSDGLLEHMDRRSIRAIFAHEAGHVINHHVFYGVMFAASAAGACFFIGELVATLAARMAWPPYVAQVASVLCLLAAWGAGFGYISRRLERQCDVMAAWLSGMDEIHADEITPATKRRPRIITLEGATVFANSLHRVAHLNGIPLRRKNWRHGSIADRVGYIMDLAERSGTSREIDRTVRRIKIASLMTAGAVTAAIVAFAAANIAAGSGG